MALPAIGAGAKARGHAYTQIPSAHFAGISNRQLCKLIPRPDAGDDDWELSDCNLCKHPQSLVLFTLAQRDEHSQS